MMEVIFSARRAGKNAHARESLKELVDQGKHVHAAHPTYTICYNGECPTLRRANFGDLEDLKK